MKRLTFCSTLVCLSLVACATTDPNSPIASNWQKAAIPLCAADTDGAVIQGSLTGATKPTFEGRVVRRGPDGSHVPIPNVRFFRYVYNFWVPGAVASWQPGESYLSPQTFGTRGDGTFRDAGHDTVPAVVLLECRDGKPTERRIKQAVIFLLRAPGCDDSRQVFDEDWVSRDIEMTCQPSAS